MSLFGQGLTGSISGNVTDQTGAPVAGAEVTVTNVSTNQVRSVQSDATGDFVFTQLLPSNYKISVVSKGFKRYEQNRYRTHCDRARGAEAHRSATRRVDPNRGSDRGNRAIANPIGGA
jgi:protocatechuate 3,4-dioxygenase beta subunit